MMRVQHYALVFMILSIIMGGVVGNVYAQPTIVIKFSHVSESNSPKGMAASHFKNLAEKMTKGRVRIHIYPNGELYEDNVALEALQLGAIQMLAPPPSKISALGFHEFELFDLPYLFPDTESLHRVTQGQIGLDLLEKLEAKGIVGLGFWDNGFKSMFSNRPLRTPSDMQALKIRVDPSSVLAAQMKKVGAIPITIGFQDMVDLLHKNVIDGMESTPSNIYSQKDVPLPKYLIVTNHGYLGYAVIANKKFWQHLPPEIRIQLQNAMQETTKYANKIAQQQNELDLVSIKESGKTTVYEPTEAEQELWREALLPLQKQKEIESRIGADLITAVRQTIGNQNN